MTFNKEYLFLSQKLHQTRGLCLRQLKTLGKEAPSTRIGIFLNPQIFLCRYQKNFSTFFLNNCFALVSSFNFFMALNSPVRHEEALECRAAVWHIFSVRSNYFNNSYSKSRFSCTHVIRLDISPRCKDATKQIL